MIEKKSEFEFTIRKGMKELLIESKLDSFIESIKRNYTKNLRDTNCDIEFDLPNYNDIFLQMIFKIGLNNNKDNMVPIDHFGDGYISMFVMAVIQSIAESENDECLFLFEEPESFLHENHQEYFYKQVLCKLSENGHQVIYTTHSDKMIDIFDTKGIIRIEFDEESQQTLNKYNVINEAEEILTLKEYNQFIKTIEPNLNKILFSKKVILVEGPNDVMAYKFAIEKKIKSEYGQDERSAETFLNFENIAIIPHHGKSTAELLIKLCIHFGIDYFVINDWDFEDFFDLSIYLNENDMKQCDFYTNSSNKGLVTTNWKLINFAGKNNIHFNIPKLEAVLGYDISNQEELSYKNKGYSLILWDKLNSLENFSNKFFPEYLEEFLEFQKLRKEIYQNYDNLQENDKHF